MLIPNRRLFGDDIASSDITPEKVFQTRRPERQDRRQFVARSAAVAAAGIAGGLLPVRALADAISTVAGAPQFETAEQQTPFGKATSFNNFYEFGTEKGEPAQWA
jgi:sulfoxide reductase catalytic subunit YedY